MNNKQAGLIGFIFLLIIILISIIAIFNYSSLNAKVVNFVEPGESVKVARVIDGDTIVLNDGRHVRLLGINAPEKGEGYHDEARDYLASLVDKKDIILKKGVGDKDRYDRLLRYIFIDDMNVNKELVKNGLAYSYFPQAGDYNKKDFRDAWKQCVDNNINLCEKSENLCAGCINLKDLSVKNQEVDLYNSCNFSCNLNNWWMKDESRKKLIIEHADIQPSGTLRIISGVGKNKNGVIHWSGYDYIFPATGDSLFLRDSKNKLVFYYEY